MRPRTYAVAAGTLAVAGIALVAAYGAFIYFDGPRRVRRRATCQGGSLVVMERERFGDGKCPGCGALLTVPPFKSVVGPDGKSYGVCSRLCAGYVKENGPRKGWPP